MYGGPTKILIPCLMVTRRGTLLAYKQVFVNFYGKFPMLDENYYFMQSDLYTCVQG